jgi:hypothetical protein
VHGKGGLVRQKVPETIPERCRQFGELTLEVLLEALGPRKVRMGPDFLARCIGFVPRRSGRFLIRPDLSRSRDVSRWRRWLTSKVGFDRACGFRYVTTYARHPVDDRRSGPAGRGGFRLTLEHPFVL